MISNRILTMETRLAVVARIKIGRKGEVRQGKSGPYQTPEKLDHILITSTERGPDNNFLPHSIMRKLSPDGKPVKAVRCSLLFNDGRDFRAQFARYEGKTLVCYGDGVTAMCGGKEIECSCGREKFGYNLKDKCKPTATLDVVLADQTTSGGVARFSTTSWNTISSIQASLAYLGELTHGYIAGVPLILALQSKTAQIPGGGSAKVFYLALLLDGTPEQITNQAIARAQIAHQQKQSFQHIKALPPPIQMIGEEEEEEESLIEDADLEEFGFEVEAAPALPPPPQAEENPKRPKMTVAEMRDAKKVLEPTPEPEPVVKDSLTNEIKPEPEPEPTIKESLTVETEQNRERMFLRGQEVLITKIDGSTCEGKILRINKKSILIEDSSTGEPITVFDSEMANMVKI